MPLEKHQDKRAVRVKNIVPTKHKYIVKTHITITVFTTPDFTLTGKMIWAYVTYILVTTIYTISNIPYGSMMPAMTKDPQERAQLSSFRIGGQNLGLLITSVAFIPIVMKFSDISIGYMVGAVIFAVLCGILNLYMYANVKERYIYVKPKEEKISLKKSYGQIFKNSPLLILSLLNLFMFSAFNMKLGVQVYFSQYNLNDISIVPYLGFFQIGFVFLAIPMVPGLVKEIGKKGIYILGAIIWAIGDVCAYFFANDAVSFVGFACIAFFGSAFINTLNWLMITDCVEYGEWKTGIREEGVVYSFYTFCRKLSQALAGFIPGLVLSFVGYVPNVEQTVRSLSGIRFLMFVSPASLAIVSAIALYFFYMLNEKKTAQVFEELKISHQNKPTAL